MSEDLDFLKEIIDDFLPEAAEFLEVVEQQNSVLAQDPQDVSAREVLAEVLHTLGRQMGFLDFDSLSGVAVGMERLLETAQQGTLQPELLTDLLLEGEEALKQGIEQLRAYDTNPLEIGDLLQRMEAAMGDTGEETDTAPAAGDDTEMLPEAKVAAISAGPVDEEDDLPQYEDEEVEETDVVEASSQEASPVVEQAETPQAEAAAPDLGELEVEEEEVEVEEGPINEEVMDFVPDFVNESSEILEKLDEDLVSLEEAGEDLDLLNEIFRAAHTLKGTSSFLGFAQMTDLTHKMENVLDLLRKGEMKLNQGMMDVILQGVDQIKILQEDIRNNMIVRRDISAVRRALMVIEATRGASTGAAPATEPAESGSVAEEVAPVEDTSPSAPPPDADKAPAQPADGGGRTTPSREADQVIRVDVDRIDKIMTLAEELVLGRNRLLQLNTSLLEEHGGDEVVSRLNEATGQVGMLTGELQESVMQMRMVPVSRVFSRFPRMVRDLARDLDKQIELVIEDHDTEIDKSVADEIGDPLIHLIRNAVDHGVESPEERQQAGKDPRGTVLLSAEHEGNHIVIRIQDDGHGMDPNRLKQKAIERGVLPEADAANMDDIDAYNLIFAPGFSMAKEVTGVSGRGVGMDVVKTNITRLNGTIELDSVLGKGTEVTIRLPLTLAIIGGLQISAGEEIFIIPLTAVLEALKISAEDIEILRGRKVILARDKVLPLIDLSAELEVQGEATDSEDRYVVVVGLAERRAGILVDHLLGQVDVVIKALGEFVGSADGIAGATILGDGRVRLILDVGELMSLMEHNGTEPTAKDLGRELEGETA